jgi:hypothetical protein
MIDVETLSLHPKTVVMSVGVSIFGPGRYPGIDGNYPLQLKPQFSKKRLVSPDTLTWWMRQSDSARESISQPESERTPVVEALKAIHQLWGDHSCNRVWGNGSHFDISIMDSLFFDFSMPIPWNYHQVRDLRTLADLCPEVPRTRPQFAHSAAGDSVAQAIWAHGMLSYLGWPE